MGIFYWLKFDINVDGMVSQQQIICWNAFLYWISFLFFFFQKKRKKFKMCNWISLI